MTLRTSLLAALIAGGVFCMGLAHAAPVKLSPGQAQALRLQVQKFAPDAPADRPIRFSAPADGISGAITLGAVHDALPPPPNELRHVCRSVVIELAQPAPMTLRSDACADINPRRLRGGELWTVAPFTTGEDDDKSDGARRHHRYDRASEMPAGPPPQYVPPQPPPVPQAVPDNAQPQLPPAGGRPVQSIARDRGPTAAMAGPPHLPTGPMETRSATIAAPSGNGQSSEGQVGGGFTRILTPVLVELPPTEPRTPRHGGSAVALLSENPADRDVNIALCRALFRTFDTATTGEVIKGERTNSSGDLEELRPLYWMLKTLKAPANADKCTSRVDRFDYQRAWSIRSKFVLNGRGPYLLVARADERRAGLVDLSGVRLADVPDMVRYFRDGFSQDSDVWTKATKPAEAQSALTAFLGHAVQLAEMPKLIVIATVRAGCPLGNFMDVCSNPLPH